MKTIAALLQIRWWDWPIDRIREAWPFLLSGKIDEFIDTYGKSGTGPGRSASAGDRRQAGENWSLVS